MPVQKVLQEGRAGAKANYRQFMALVQRYVELCELRLDL